MIYVLEVPLEGEPHAWFAFHGQDMFNKVMVGESLASWEVHDQTSARELLDMVGHEPGTPQALSQFPGICRLADEFGWDTALYRADHLLGRGVYQPEAVSVEAACDAAMHARVGLSAAEGGLKAVRIYWSDPEAVLATEGDEPLFKASGGWRAMHALREQLLALDVLAEN